MINWETVEGAVAGITSADDYTAKVSELRALIAQADQVARLKARYETADKLRADAVAVLIKAQEKEADVVRREAAIAPREQKLDARAKQLDERAELVARREREVDQRHAHLSEIARAAAA